MEILRDDAGRLRAVWRLGVFLVLAVLGILAFHLLIGLPLVLLPEETAARIAALGSPLASAVAVLAASAFVMERIEGIPVAALGIPVDRLLAGELLRGFALGAVLIGAAVLALALTGSLSWSVSPGELHAGSLLASLATLTVFFGLAAFLEELLVRGYPFQVVAEQAGVVAAIAVTAVAFSLLHLPNPGLGWEALAEPTLESVLPLVNIGLAGVLFGVAVWRTFSLWFATGIHLGWNWIMVGPSDLPVSGLGPDQPGYGFLDTPGIEASLEGPVVWTGGTFGPEGGLAVTAVTVAAIVWMARTPRLKRSMRVRALGPLLDRAPERPWRRESGDGGDGRRGGGRR